jgi:adenylate kinase
MLNIILFGPPGSGKGTQSALIVEKFKLRHLSTGDILREEISRKTELGKVAESYISNGQLVPDKMIIDILLKSIQNDDRKSNGIILDGFPRTLVQAQALEEILEEHNRRISVLIEIHLDDNVLIERLTKRGETSGRTDDNIESIKKRLEVYKLQSKPAAQFYKSLNKYAAVDGLGTIEEIFERISAIIESQL